MKYGDIVRTPKPSLQKIMVTLRMERELNARLKREAEKAGVTPSEKLRRILDKALPKAA